jgi:hypothetical protein
MTKLFLALGLAFALAVGGAAAVTFASVPAMAGCGTGC